MKYLIILSLLLSYNFSKAACNQEFVCDTYGSCSMKEVCENSYDKVNIEQNQRINEVDVPNKTTPFGTTICSNKYVNGVLTEVCE